VRNPDGTIIANREVSLKINMLKGDEHSNSVYS
jgi:hypothetical protein